MFVIKTCFQWWSYSLSEQIISSDSLVEASSLTITVIRIYCSTPIFNHFQYLMVSQILDLLKDNCHSCTNMGDTTYNSRSFQCYDLVIFVQPTLRLPLSLRSPISSSSITSYFYEVVSLPPRGVISYDYILFTYCNVFL